MTNETTQAAVESTELVNDIQHNVTAQIEEAKETPAKATKKTSKKTAPKKSPKKTATKPAPKSRKSSKKTAENTAPVKSKKTSKKADKKATPKAETNGHVAPRKVTVGKEEWPAKQAAVLCILKRSKGEDLSKPQIAEAIKAFGMGSDLINHFCYILRDLGLAYVSVYEADRTHYRSATPKGMKVELPAPFNK